MICEQAYELMSAKLDGALSTGQEAELAAHLASCPKCRRVMEAMQAVEASVSALREPAPEGKVRQAEMDWSRHGLRCSSRPAGASGRSGRDSTAPPAL